ncbi:hypothetical protein [Sandaracinus amylolyticus]|uniref:Outer membrane protein beta-barrel domain-containing protein n=1 Tax=Sandaracinus amylolyticus TaxID=927083 RepID=A0A0F6W960_9BACT|nr:hypothetical protein [Sandaracinus amylolyticus]AKF10521.1 hypothetical protein DB32_007670 [Sandaracinus amylolyticus]
MRFHLAALVLALGIASSARAQSAEDGWAPPTEEVRPTSGEASFLSGRTLGVGQVLMAAALGWPGLWAHVELAPDSTFNVGARVAVVYGSPVMGLVTGAGGELIVPMRVHLFGEGDVDLALRIAPQVALGEGRLFGEAEGVRANDLGVSSRLEVGPRLGWRVAERVTVLAGVDAGAGVSWTNGEDVRAIGTFSATLGIEALMTLQTMLFAEVSGGAGVADGSGRAVPLYPQQEIFRLSLGLAYVL